MGPNELKQTVFKLAHFDPTCQDDYGYQIADYLILDALAVFGPLLAVTAIEVQDNIKKSFHIFFEEDEINSSAKRLAQKGQIDYTGEDSRTSRPRFKILPETKE